MSIGLLRGKVILENHDPEWEINASQIVAKLKAILQNVAVDIQHVGSTAIKNIVAKPIIDIVIGVNDFNDILNMNEILASSGFIFRGQDHPDQYLYICGEQDFITHHIHVVIYNSESWNNYINLRDYLNSHEDEARDYSLLKLSLAEKYADERKTYTAMKSDFINQLLKKALLWRNAQK